MAANADDVYAGMSDWLVVAIVVTMAIEVAYQSTEMMFMFSSGFNADTQYLCPCS